MWLWLKKILGQDQADHVKSYDEVASEVHVKDYEKKGVKSIPMDKIVGSVGRAEELDANFRYRERATTARYHWIADAIRQGVPMNPIKVIKVKRERAQTEYYVVDGHHRVAEAKKMGLDEMNADITEAILDDQEKD